MSILFITNVFPNPVEMTKGIFNFHLARALSEKHQVRVVSPVSWLEEGRALARGRRPFRHGRRLACDGVEIHYPRYYYPPKLFHESYGSFYWHSVRGTLRRLVQSSMPEAVLGYWIHPDGEAVVRIAEQLDVPSAVIVGGSDALLITRKPARRRRVLGVLHAVNAVLTVNNHLRSVLIQLGVDPTKIHVWSQGVDATFSPGGRISARKNLGLSSTGYLLVWVGRMVPVKGLDLLLKACTLLQDRGVEFHLCLIGDGPLHSRLREDRDACGLSSRVSFIGAKGQHELADWYRAADLTVLPSRSEGLPNVLRESLACGTPFVASHVGGISEIGDNSCRILVPPEDPQALAEAIQRGLCRWASAERPVISPRFMTWSESAESLLRILKPLTSASPVAVS